MTSAIIIQVKNENKYLDEWISYNKNLGIDHIYMIDNNDINGEYPQEVINKYGDYITYINERGNTVKDFQTSTYKIVYNEFKELYDWFAFIDIDEFITLNFDNNINDYLSRNIFNNVDQICLNWVIYDDNDLIHVDYNIPVQERFTRRMLHDYDKEYPLYNLQKCILRGNLNIDEHRVHNIVNFAIPFRTVNNCGEELNQLHGSSSHNEDLAYIKHYMTKSLEEFIIKKYNQYDTNHDGKYDFEKGYFSINKHTDEKDKYIQNYLNSINNKSSIKYTILTCLFGDYDILKEPEEVDDNAEYICITNREDLKSDVWKIIIDNNFDESDNFLQRSFKVKYDRLFNYISPESKYVVRLDASIIIHQSLYDIIRYIDENDYEMCVMLHTECNDLIDEYNRWELLRNHPKIFKDTFIRKMSNEGFNINSKGLIETTFQIYRTSDKVKNVVKEISNIIKETSNYTDNNDQCYYTYIMYKHINEVNPLFVNRQIISSKYMDLCYHYSDNIVYTDHIHARGPEGEFEYDLDKPIYYDIFNKIYKVNYFI